MSDVVRFDGSCEDLDVDDQPTICAWHEKTDQPGASHGICARCKLVYFELPHVVVPRLYSVVARLDGGNYLGGSMRSELAADLRVIIARLTGTRSGPR